MLERLARLLPEPAMGFLGLAALVFGVAPMLFPIGPGVDTLLDVGNWVIVVLFALEYATHLLLAENKLSFALNPWRLFDLFIILAPFISLVPGMPSAAKSAPVLRVVRLVRVILAGTRASRRLRHHMLAAPKRVAHGPPIVTELDPDSDQAAERSWAEVMAWARKPATGWIHAGNLEPARIAELAEASGIPRERIESALGPASFPRLESIGRWSVLNLPLFRDEGGREPILLLVSEHGVLSLSQFRSELQHGARPLPGARGQWPARVVLGIVRFALQRHEEFAVRFERALRALEELQAEDSPHEFFVEVFRLRKRMTASKADLWRLHGLLQAVRAGRRSLPGFTPQAEGDLERVIEEAAFLHETADGLREALLSLLDLHLNISGFGMNRFMRLLAIVSALALIPTIVGGLLGMNLVTNPWPATLAQVAFGTFVLMVCVLYVFQAKGWLSS